MSFAIVTEILEGTWLFGKTFCSIWSSLDILHCSASIWNLCGKKIAEINVNKGPNNRSPSLVSNQILNVIQDKIKASHSEKIQMSKTHDASYSLSSINQNLATVTTTTKMDFA